jgi:imidazolonepropionase-like amidohydrolase
MKHIAGFVALFALSAPLFAATEEYSILFGGEKVGTLVADSTGATTKINFDYKNNGRGPTIAETVTVDAKGLPIAWQVNGATTFGSKVAETFTLTDGVARWADATGPGEAKVGSPAVYVAQSASPYALGLYARALDTAGGTLPALPGGALKLEKIGGFDIKGNGGVLPVTAYSLAGLDLDKQTIFLDADKRLVAFATPEFITIRKGYEGEDARLRKMVAGWDTERLATYQQQLAHKPAGNLRIDNVRIFDPATLALTAPSSVLVKGNKIASIDKPGKRASGETVVDGKGGTLLAGFNEMHAHLGQSDALLNLMAGITTVRDMGNDDAVLDKLVERMEAGELAGPRVVRSAFIEGKSKTNAANGTVVASEAEAVKAVQDGARRGVFQIKIYSSINPQWVPAMIAEAHRNGLRVAGHIPAFTTTDDMLNAGYDEITHSNQMMLNWVLKPEDDTRTLLRVTALKRFADVDLNGPAPQKTLGLMVQHKAAHDPTLIIMETATLGRRGQLPPGAVAWAGHMPVGLQRDLKQPMLAIETPEDDAAYAKSFEVTRDYMRKLNDAGVMILPGTDMGGHFWYHRELELYSTIGMSNAEVLKRATYDTAKYMKRDDRFGAVKPGLVADLVLLPADPVADINAIKTIAMVVKDGTVYFPTEAYEKLGIKPFTTVPAVSGAGFATR